MPTENLLDEFPPVSTQAWEDTIARDLKGSDYARKLIWQTEDGFAIKPYYRSEDIAGLSWLDTAPGSFPYVRGSQLSGDWRIREEIEAVDPEQANRDAQNAIAAGAEEIAFLNVLVRNASDLRLLFADIHATPLHFTNADEPLLSLLVKQFKGTNDPPRVSTGWNPLANLEYAAQVALVAPSALVPLSIDGSAFEESGATTIEEIGFTLAAAVEYLREMQSRSVDPSRAAALVAFSFSIGSDYFFQIAKLRSFRMLWAQVVESFGGTAESARTCIHARTSRWNTTIYDPYVNVLRATTEAMSAILGGADSITVAPFDEGYKMPDEASRRLARNTQIILKREALLAQVADPAAGSYYLETLTDFIAREGWKVMQRIEGAGGFRKANTDGLLAKVLEQSLSSKERDVALRRRVFTGTNQFANSLERVLDRVDPVTHTSSRRGAQSYESLRLRTERHAMTTGATPRVLLAQFGDVKMSSARSTFAANFFACAGFDIATQRIQNADEIAANEADLILLCSSDLEYLAFATDLSLKLKKSGHSTPVIVAGDPENSEALRTVGVADFIHIRSNPIEVLTIWQQKLGIKA